MKTPVFDYWDIAPTVRSAVHGTHKKSLIVLHETVSHDIAGWADVKANVRYLDSKGYGIHSVNDFEGNIAYAYGLGQAVFYQAGGVNEISIGIEQVSWIPAMLQAKQITKAHAGILWRHRTAQLHATAKTIAVVGKAHDIPLVYVPGNGRHKGVTTHWSVSQYFEASEGHADCWPVNDDGYYPTGLVMDLARRYRDAGITLKPPKG